MYTNFSRKARVLGGLRKGDIKLQVVNQRDANYTAETEFGRLSGFLMKSCGGLNFLSH
jgi:hypothetical protein